VTAPGNDTRYLLFGTDELTYGPHQVTMTNGDGGMMLDLVEFGVELGAQG
jgi:hypothetical protein